MGRASNIKVLYHLYMNSNSSDNNILRQSYLYNMHFYTGQCFYFAVKHCNMEKLAKFY